MITMAKDRDDDRKRHRSHSKRHKDDRHRKSSRKDGNEDSKKLTSEERLYETAKAYVHQQQRHDKDDRDNKRDKKSRRSKSDERKDDRKRSRKDHHREKKSSKHRHDKDDRKRRKHNIPSVDIDTSKLISLGPITGKSPKEQLDSSLNYFSHNPHLRLYLYRTHGLYFEDLSSDSSRKYFAEFVDKYNSGALEETYYQPQLPQEVLDQCSRTKHQWKFKTNEMEDEKLNLVKAGVKKQTEYDVGAKKPVVDAPPVNGHATAAPPKKDKDEYDREQSHLEKRSAQKLSDKRYRERIELANEEIYGVSSDKPSSMRERQQMKKREQANKTHGAHQDREDTMVGQDLDDDAIYGSGEIMGGGGRRRSREMGFNEAVAKERAKREKRQAEMAQKVEEGKRKEEEKRKEMLSMLGLSGMDAGKKITIAPRRDG